MAGFFVPDGLGLDAAAHAAAMWGMGQGQVYAGINPRRTDLLNNVARNRMVPTGRAGRLEDVAAVTAILIDIDPVRPKGTASTDEELAAAQAVARKIDRWWRNQGWNPTLVAMSGNGWHLWARVPPQNPTVFPAHLRTFLADIARQFKDSAADIDLSVADAPRIAKVPGTVSIKGENTKNRPWRRSRITAWADPVPNATLASHILSLPPMRTAAQPPARRTTTGPREKHPREKLNLVLSRCRFLLWAAEHPAAVREPAWYALAANLAAFDGGREAFHRLSEGHPEYRRDDADRKFDHAERDAPGPTTCRRLAELGEMGFVCPLLGICPAKAPAALAHVDDNRWQIVLKTHDNPTCDDAFMLAAANFDALDGREREAVSYLEMLFGPGKAKKELRRQKRWWTDAAGR